MLDLNYYYSFKKHLDYLLNQLGNVTIALSRNNFDECDFNDVAEYYLTFDKFKSRVLCYYIRYEWASYFNINYLLNNNYRIG
jgi:hypothetical protein